MIIPNIWQNKKCSKPPISSACLHLVFTLNTLTAVNGPRHSTSLPHHHGADAPRLTGWPSVGGLLGSLDLPIETFNCLGKLPDIFHFYVVYPSSGNKASTSKMTHVWIMCVYQRLLNMCRDSLSFLHGATALSTNHCFYAARYFDCDTQPLVIRTRLCRLENLKAVMLSNMMYLPSLSLLTLMAERNGQGKLPTATYQCNIPIKLEKINTTWLQLEETWARTKRNLRICQWQNMGKATWVWAGILRTKKDGEEIKSPKGNYWVWMQPAGFAVPKKQTVENPAPLTSKNSAFYRYGGHVLLHCMALNNH